VVGAGRIDLLTGQTVLVVGKARMLCYLFVTAQMRTTSDKGNSMNLPSVTQLTQQSARTFLRFPFTILDGVFGSVVSCILINNDGTDEKLLFNLLMTTALGIPLFTTIVIVAEKKKWSRAMNLLAQSIGALLLAAYMMSLPGEGAYSPSVHVIRFFVFVVALHLLVASAPFAGKGEINGFWQYNKALFLRFLTAVLYSGVLYTGLAIALSSIDHLFSIDISGRRYFQLWSIISGVFNTWFFLAGVPGDLDALDGQTEYPKGLKIFTQYILIPLVIVYLVILYAYEVKILAEWNWPKGWVANLVLGFSITGILSLLLVYPIRDRVENVWIRTFSKWYYIVLVPLVGLLLLAIWRRISDYGITENRYFVLVLGFWLAGIVLYFLASKVKNIKVIPMSLCVIACMVSFGPWGAFSVSEQSQIGRLRNLLIKAKVLVDGKIQKAVERVSFEDSKEVSSLIRYLSDVHDLDGIQPWFREDLKSLGKGKIESQTKNVHFADPKVVVELMGLEYFNQWESSRGHSYQFSANRQGVSNVKGFDQLIRSQHVGRWDTAKDLGIWGSHLRMDPDMRGLTISVRVPDQVLDSVHIMLGPLADSLIKEYGHTSPYNIPAEKMSIGQSGRTFKTKMCFLQLQAERSDDSTKVQYIEADILLGTTTR